MIPAEWDTSPFGEPSGRSVKMSESYLARCRKPRLSEAEEIQRYTLSLPELSDEDKRIGELATAILREKLEQVEAGHLRWDDRSLDWVMTRRHPAYGLEGLLDDSD